MIVKSISIPIRHNGCRYTAGEEFEIDDAGYERIANHLEVVDAVENAADEPIEEMKVEELKAYAAKHNIDLAGATTKADILAAIQAASGGGNVS